MGLPRHLVFALASLVLLGSLCAGVSAAPGAAPVPVPEKITVFAAASLKESLDAVATRWTQLSGQDVVVSYAASSALARQVEQGAPAHVFISADEEWMDYLQQRALVDPASRYDLVGNQLVVIAPADSPQQALALDAAGLRAALGEKGRLAVAETSAVPAGRYARTALERRGLWATVQARLAQGDNVRAALAFVARGEAPLGVVYATDAKAEPRVRVVARFDAADHPAIVYPAARVTSADATQVDGFLVFLRGEEARRVFDAAGFTMP